MFYGSELELLNCTAKATCLDPAIKCDVLKDAEDGEEEPTSALSQEQESQMKSEFPTVILPDETSCGVASLSSSPLKTSENFNRMNKE